MNKISLRGNSNIAKHRQLTEAISQSINNGKFYQGEVLPSINELSTTLKISRDTVFKAYTALKKLGLVGSSPAKGYFVAGIEPNIFMFLDSYSPFKEILYKSFRENIQPGTKVDLAFHHYNPSVFDAVINNIAGKYSYYLVTNIDNGPMAKTLKKLDQSRLLMLDWGQYSDMSVSFVCQDFKLALKQCLSNLLGQIKKYKRLVIYYPENCEHPYESVDTIEQFCIEHKIQSLVIKSHQNLTEFEGALWILFRQNELVEVIKHLKSTRLNIGKDFGIIAYNDSPLYEIIEGGITAISTNFNLMGKYAAEFITVKKEIQMLVQTKVIMRNSL